ncbi:MAG: NAD(P)/FAD-dependent oxidoreductase [Oscillospiraceae bacterium]|jgi:predicted Rossmann fold flavoprotein|nr:NAD(P)/FAD-dependent oxidoreductase [Oscillospiraceae bacterium]
MCGENERKTRRPESETDRGTAVTVIGAGAAGLMAAVSAARRGAQVLLLERNDRPGVKLSITGKGRCNLTNDCGADAFLENCNDKKFLRGALARFSPRDTAAFFEGLGVPLVTERGRRVFPASGRAADVVSALVRETVRLGVVRRQVRVTAPDFSKGPVIIATGGLSYPKTGSTGDGYGMAGRAGHTVTPLSPSLVPLVSPDAFCAALQGLSLRNVTLRLLDGVGRAVFCEGPGEMLFTHFGLSGPLVLSASAHWREGLSAGVDLKPGLTERLLSARLDRDLIKYGARDVRNALGDLLHKRLIPVIIALAGIDPRGRTAELTRAERLALLRVIKCFPVTLSGTRPVDEAVITRGGVSLREIDPRTMRSKLRDGLYFAGEVLDLDGYTGGYNLQIAWSTGYAAGESAAGECLA